MANIGALITAFGTGGTGAVVISALRGLSDERTKRRQEKKAAAREPQEAKSYELRIAERAGRIAETAGEIQQQAMEDLRQAYAELNARYGELSRAFEKYKKDTEAQREKDLREADRLRDHDRQQLDDARGEISRLKDQVHDQDATIARLRFELQQAQAGP